jgi:hypothetical protein
MEIMNRQKIAEQRQAKINAFFRKAKEQHLRNEEVRIRKERIQKRR